MRYTRIVSCGLMALVLASSTALTQAQTVPVVSPSSVQTSGAAAGEVLIKENLFTVSPALETELSADSAVPVQLQFNAQPNTTEAVDISGITAEGFTRKVSVNGEEIAQVVVTRLKKDADFVDLEADKFTSQFGVESNRLLPTTAISVNGDEAEFVQAVARLSGTEETAEPEEELEDKENTVEDDTSVDEGGGSENPIAEGYQTPERLERQEEEPEEERDPNMTINVSTDGCEPQIDLGSGIVRQTAKTETLEDGIVTETDACSPNGIVWNIQRNYEACEDLVDEAALLARPQYTSFYNDDRGARFDLAACQPDQSISFAISESRDECKPNVDIEGEQVTLLTRLTYRDRTGKDVAVSECAPSKTVFEMEREYGSCSDAVDLEAGIANAQYTLSYTDEKASRQKVSECMPDEEQAFKIEEKQNCTFDFDLENGEAIVNTSLIYTNGDKVEVSVHECAPSETIEPIQMTAEPNGCSMRHDFGTGVSTEMAMWTYEYEGQLFQASPCITTETTYTHNRVFDKNGIDVCTPIVDMASGKAVRQYRTEIIVTGTSEVIAGCQPDEANMLGIFSTVNGCDDPASFDHDLAAGLSYGLERYYYDVPGRGRTYVTACQRNDQKFTHSVAPNGWKYNDAKLRAQQLVDVSIKVNAKAFKIATSYLQPGTSEIAYTFVRNQDSPDYSRKYYNGCTEMVPTKRTKIYTRPDGSSYAKASGDGTTLNNGDKCQRSTETRKLNGYRVNVSAKGYTLVVRDGSGNYTTVSGNCGGSSKTLTGNPGYSLVRANGPVSTCRYPEYKLTHYNRIDERSKVVYPTGKVTYSSWKTVRWET
ncbi:hypothetical protein [Roseibium aggregatum]|uniref:Uncharacterized protein n=1 Tax=Roseibium aggregatum TaxID=187304 RepID=A0A0M6YDP6_9HYPH|nr:hypothetical protein [Roseibium aggregatum]CTQ47559.1 hypothetical protein LAL4801_06021 [Roseibium aggregatum]